MRAIPLLLLLCAATAHAQDAEVRAFLERVKPPVLLARPGMEAVRVRRDLVYQDGPKQKADVYAPPRARKPAPIVIFIHGGMGPEFPVRPKEWGIYQSWGRLMAASGLTAIVFNHRAGFPKVELAAATADLRDAVSWARAQARSWNADPERICLLAF
jgi:acetyl esterase/lipase